MKRKSDISHSCQIEPEYSDERRAKETAHNEQEEEEWSAGETGSESEDTLEQGETDGHYESEAECEAQRKEPFASTITAPSDISKCRGDPPVQPMLRIYPRMGDRRRGFKAAWYNFHPRFESSKNSDSAYCFECRPFSPPKSSEMVFTSEAGFCNWKKATYKEGGFANHSRSERHKHAINAWRDFQKAVQNVATLLNSLNKEHNKEIQENLDYIKTNSNIKTIGISPIFDSLWNEVLTTAEQCGTAIQPAAKQTKKLNSQLGGHCVLSTVGQKRSDSELVKESFYTCFSTLF